MYPGNQMFKQQFWANGPAPGQFYNFTGGQSNAYMNPMPREYTAPGSFGTQHSR